MATIDPLARRGPRWAGGVGSAVFVGASGLILAMLLETLLVWSVGVATLPEIDPTFETSDIAFVPFFLLNTGPAVAVGLVLMVAGLLLLWRCRWSISILDGVLGGVVGGAVLCAVLWWGAHALMSALYSVPPV